MKIGWRNPIEFVTQWYDFEGRIRAMFIWCFYVWSSNDLDIWLRRGIRIFGIEVCWYKYF